MFNWNNPRLILILAIVALGLVVGCAKPPEPCSVGADQVSAAQGDAKKAQADLTASQAEVKDLEAELKAKQKSLQDLEAQKAELDALKSKVEGDGPPKR
jgi:peptidoglycan hydrolase CwlO-like protein